MGILDFKAQCFDLVTFANSHLDIGWELGGMLASSGTALAAEFFGTMTAAIYPDASRSTLRS